MRKPVNNINAEVRSSREEIRLREQREKALNKLEQLRKKSVAWDGTAEVRKWRDS